MRPRTYFALVLFAAFLSVSLSAPAAEEKLAADSKPAEKAPAAKKKPRHYHPRDAKGMAGPGESAGGQKEAKKPAQDPMKEQKQ